MKSNIGFVGNNYKWFIGQVAPGQNEHVKGAAWKDAHGDRVKIRIPGQHPKTAEVTDDNLPWAIVAKPTSSGNSNRSSSGVWGGEWVIGFYMDEGCQIPVITQVLGRGAIDPKLTGSINGTTNLENVSSYNSGLQPGNHQMIGGSTKKSDPRTLPVSEEDKEKAKGTPTSANVSESGIPKEPTITKNPDGSTTVTFTEKVDGEILKSSVVLQPGSQVSSGLLKRQETAFNLEMSREAVGRGDQAAANYYSDRLKGGGFSAPSNSTFNSSKLSSSRTQVAEYTAKDRAEDKLLLKSIQRGELGPIPREQIDAIINRINGVGGLVRGA